MFKSLTEKWQLHIADHHIRDGIPGNADQCAIADAIKWNRPNKHIHSGVVTPSNIRLKYDTYEDMYETGAELHDWIQDFDSEKDVEPITIEFDPDTAGVDVIS